MSSKPVEGKGASVSFEPFVFAAFGSENLSDETGGMGARREALPHASAGSNFSEQKLYEKGLADGEARAQAAFEKALAGVRGEIAEALGQFAEQREIYFQRVES